MATACNNCKNLLFFTEECFATPLEEVFDPISGATKAKRYAPVRDVNKGDCPKFEKRQLITIAPPEPKRSRVREWLCDWGFLP